MLIFYILDTFFQYMYQEKEGIYSPSLFQNVYRTLHHSSIRWSFCQLNSHAFPINDIE